MKRTGNSKIAVVGWGRGMGHQGHMYLADAVIVQAQGMNADPYFFVSKTVGKDDPLFPEEKVRIYQKVFPQYANIFTPEGNLNQALEQLVQLGYQGVVVVVGADQKQAFQYLEKPNKEGVPVYQSMGLKKLKVISRQETRSKFRNEEGPRATPMREILLDPNSTEEDKFKVWRRDMPKELGDRDVLDIMNKAESRLVHATQPKQVKVKQMSQKATKLKEAILSFRTKKDIPKQEPKDSDSLSGYAHLFKPKEQPAQSDEKRFHGWQEYEKDKNPEAVEETRIFDRNAKINAYYVSPTTKQRHKVAEGIPYYLLDRLVDALTKKYSITMNDIEVRPADQSQYRRSTKPEMSEGIFGIGGPAVGAPLASTNEYNRLSGATKLRHDASVALKMVDSLKQTNHNGYYDEEIKKKLRLAQDCLAKAKEIEKQGLTEGSDNIEAGDKITWYYSNHYPEIEGTVVGWKDGHLIVQSVDPSPRNTEKTVANYRVPKNNIRSVQKQGVDEAYDGFGKFDAAEFQRHMDKLRAREELRKTDPMKALVGDLIDKDREKEALAKRKKPEDDSIGINDPRHPGYAYTQMGQTNIDENTDGLNYIGNCTDDDVIEHIFGDATGFAQAVDEHGDEFTLGDLVVKYDPETDVHSFYSKQQGVAEGSLKNKLAAAALAGTMATGAHGVVLNPARPIGPATANRPAPTVANPYPQPYEVQHPLNPLNPLSPTYVGKQNPDAERLKKNTEIVDKEQRVNHHKLDEFAPGNGDDDGEDYDLEYQVFQCNPENEFDFIGGPLHQDNDLGRAHGFAYKLHMKYPDKAFMVYQPSREFSRGGYGIKDEESNEDYLDE